MSQNISPKITFSLLSILLLGFIGTAWWMSGGFDSRTPQTEVQAQSKLPELKQSIVRSDPDGELFNVTATRVNGPIAVVTVTDRFNALPYQTRYQFAQTLQQLWAKLYSPTEPDKAGLALHDASGNRVGGSGAMGGTVVDVRR